ncbi:phage tail tape measure protein [Clostridium tyrobutyricum]|uniref:phage tail tape measure protein n=1 Tax=Clostridium tyrobutyricum TaxID=1519 RepID=UPI001C3802A2|nr:phage tail tape measure protein [Clostridium tyrobutyricum]MBV4450247.1 phage tail tape measure protein [Clostridium tyrobutyricum]
MAINAGTVVAYMELDTSRFSSGLKTAGQQLKQFMNSHNSIENRLKSLSGAMKSVGGTLTSHVTAPIAVMGASIIKTGMEFEKQMSKVQAISGATGSQLEQLKKQAIDLGAATTFSATEAAQGQENLASAGFSVKEIMEAMPGVLNMAAAGDVDIATASDYAATTLRSFGLEASKATHVADVLAKQAAVTNAGIVDTGYAMKYVAPIAHSLGFNMEETAAAIGILANYGIKGSQAGTTLRQAFTRMAKPTKTAKAVMEELGISFFDAQGKIKPLASIIGELQEKMKGLTSQQKDANMNILFGQTAMGGMLDLVDSGPKKLKSLTNELKNSDGASKKMAHTMTDNLAGAIENLMGTIESVKLRIYEMHSSSLVYLVNKIADLIDKFNKASPAVQYFIVKMAILAATIGPVLLITSKLISAVSTIIGLFKGTGSIISRLIKHFTGASKESDKTANKLLKTGEAANKASASLAKVAEVAGKASVSLAEVGKAVGSSAKRLLEINSSSSSTAKALSKLSKEGNSAAKAITKMNSAGTRAARVLSRVTKASEKATIALTNTNMAAREVAWEFNRIDKEGKGAARSISNTGKGAGGLRGIFSRLGQSIKNIPTLFSRTGSSASKLGGNLSKVNKESAKVPGIFSRIKSTGSKIATLFGGIGSAGGKLPNVFSKIGTSLGKLPGIFGRVGSSAGKLPSIFTKIGSLISNATKSILGSFGKLINGSGKLGKAFNLIKVISKAVFSALPAIINPPVLITIGIIAGIGLIVYEVIKHWSGFKKKAMAFWQGFKKGLKDAFSGMPFAFFGIGGAIVAGLIKGFEKAFPNATKKIKGFAESVKNTFKKILDINSPSGVFRQYAIYIGQGFNIGIDKIHGFVMSKVAHAANSIKSTFGNILQPNSLLKYGNTLGNQFVNGIYSSREKLKNQINAFSKQILSLREIKPKLNDIALGINASGDGFNKNTINNIKKSNSSKLLNFDPKINLYVTVADTGEKGTAKLTNEVKSMAKTSLKNGLVDFFMNDVIRD